jgi:hypothetical protein
MSYDIYCYRSQTGKPDLEEAQSILESEEEGNNSQAEPGSKEKIAKALIAFNPRLEIFVFDYEEIAKRQGITVEQAKEKHNHIELNTPEGDLATQFYISDEYVGISIPYWYEGEQAREVFDNINSYTKVIRQTAGYFVYDPQTENVFDPETESFNDFSIFSATSDATQNMMNTGTETKKPWWKFW